jgi:hypothetical protein
MDKDSRELPDRRKAFKKMGSWLLAGGGALTVGYFAIGREGPIDEWLTVKRSGTSGWEVRGPGRSRPTELV